MIGLYIHVPFCLKKCNYCDFVSYPYDAPTAASYVAGLVGELNLYGQILKGTDKRLASIYFGGGTPSLLSVGEMEDIFAAVNRFYSVPSNIEITVEVNPGTVNKQKLKELHRLGCNRLSIGVQSANSGILKDLGRIHTLEEAEETYALAREIGFRNVNLDLIFGIPGQSLGDWKNTLSWAVSLRPEHISAYSLKIEEGTPFAQKVDAGEMELIDEETDLAMFLEGIDFLRDAGYEHYEISNFCLPGRESLHNLRYWDNGEYLGVGASAHSYMDRIRFYNFSSLEQYMKAVEERRFPVAERKEIKRNDEISERIFLALRKLKGLDLIKFQKDFGQGLEELFATELDKLGKLGLVTVEEGFLRLTRKGLPVANEVFAEFILLDKAT